MTFKKTALISFLSLSTVLYSCGGNVSEDNISNTPADTNISEVRQAPIPAAHPSLSYEVIWESGDRRYDNAPMYLVVTDKNTHEHMHQLVDEFARKLSSKKFTLIAYDDEKAAQVYKASHYGTNEVDRIATEAELKIMDKHIIGTYNGELEALGTPYEIMYHGFGVEEESSEEYEPKL